MYNKVTVPPITLKARLNVGDYHPHYMMITVNLCLGAIGVSKARYFKYPLKSWNIYFLFSFFDRL